MNQSVVTTVVAILMLAIGIVHSAVLFLLPPLAIIPINLDLKACAEALKVIDAEIGAILKVVATVIDQFKTLRIKVKVGAFTACLKDKCLASTASVAMGAFLGCGVLFSTAIFGYIVLSKIRKTNVHLLTVSLLAYATMFTSAAGLGLLYLSPELYDFYEIATDKIPKVIMNLVGKTIIKYFKKVFPPQPVELDEKALAALVLALAAGFVAVILIHCQNRKGRFRSQQTTYGQTLKTPKKLPRSKLQPYR